MVRLTMTPAIVAAAETYNDLHVKSRLSDIDAEPSLAKPAVGNPIAHGQIITISKHLGTLNEHLRDEEPLSSTIAEPYHLDNLLRGSRIYYDPPKPKPEPVKPFVLMWIE